jgi:hypothetical protein
MIDEQKNPQEPPHRGSEEQPPMKSDVGRPEGSNMTAEGESSDAGKTE